MQQLIKSTVRLLLALVTLVGYAQAQTEKPTPNELDEQYTPKGKNILSANDTKASKTGKKGSAEYPKNIININVSLLSRNIAALSYERLLGESFALCGGVGFNYGVDNIFKTASSYTLNAIDDYSTEENELSIPIVYSNGKSKATPYFYLATKFINENSNNDNYHYFEFMYAHYTNKIEYNTPFVGDINGYNYVVVGDKTVANYSINNLALKFGTQLLTNSKLITSHEFFIAGGINVLGFSKIFETRAENSSAVYQITYTPSTNKYTKLLPYFTLGYNLGIGWGK